MRVAWLCPLVLAVGIVFVIWGSAAYGSPGCHSSRRCVERVARKRCDNRHVVACIQRAALHRRLSFALLRKVAVCESGLDPFEVEPSTDAEGLFQFEGPTWGGTPYGRHSRQSAKWNALGAAWLIQRGGLGPWTASEPCWG